jgi:hypothetical protein
MNVITKREQLDEKTTAIHVVMKNKSRLADEFSHRMTWAII